MPFRPVTPWPYPGDDAFPCCDDYLPCYCYALNFEDYDRIKQERETLLQEIEAFENAPDYLLAAYRRGDIRYRDVVAPVPPPSKRLYPQFTWRSTDRVEEVVHAISLRVAQCDPGNRNNTLNSAAFFFGQLVQGGRLDLEHACYRLGEAARAARLPLHEAATTVRLALQAGMRHESENPYERGNPPLSRRPPGASTSPG